jgi:NAD(P)H-dependent flavin oxidoreductase YrpB (nitropropane dioxygenase family)
MRFDKLILTPAGEPGEVLAIAACRSGAAGIVNFEFGGAAEKWYAALERVADACDGGFGIKLVSLAPQEEFYLTDSARRGLRWVILDGAACNAAQVRRLQGAGLCVLAEVLSAQRPASPLEGVVDGLMLKGSEAGGLVGEDSSFILLQKWLGRTGLPLYLRGVMPPRR